MNCKPGELAVIVNEDADCKCNIGAFLKVTKRCDAITPDGWLFCDATRPLKFFDIDDGKISWAQSSDENPAYWTTIPDRFLRPIRDPGDDAQDETLSWLPVPTTEGVPA